MRVGEVRPEGRRWRWRRRVVGAGLGINWGLQSRWGGYGVLAGGGGMGR
jgi:hypothetical protein